MGERQVEYLSYAVRGRVILKYFGQLCTVLASLTLVTVFVSLLFHEYLYTLHYSALFVVVAILGILLSRIPASSNIQPNEALVITALIFLFSSVALAYPMTVAGLSFEDALFESVSAFTTTGLSTTVSLKEKPYTFLFSRAWMQWSGGLGIVVLSVALLIRPGIEARRLVDVEKAEDFVGGTRVYALKVLKIYIALTLTGIIALILLGVNSFSAVAHVLSSVSTGGFSIYDNSLAGFGWWAPQAVIIILSLSGAFSLILYHNALRKGWKEFFLDPEVKAIFILASCGAVLIFFFAGVNMELPLPSALWNSLILAFSAHTTAGFTPLNVFMLDPATKLILIFLMMFGGSIGSTAGGFKVLRLLIMIKMLRLIIVRTSLPEHAVVEPRLSGQRILSEDIERALLIILLFMILILFSWMPFVILGYDPLDALFEVVSAVGTVGLSSGISSPELPAILKGVLCADMIMGRLEIIALLVLAYPKTWFGRRTQT